MYGAAIPEDAEAMGSKQPKNQAPTRRGYGLVGLVVALCVGVMIGALGTALLTPAPTPAPRPVLAQNLKQVKCYQFETAETENEKCLNKVTEMAQLGKYFASPFCTDCIDNFERCLYH